jgi:hypothetical protein
LYILIVAASEDFGELGDRDDENHGTDETGPSKKANKLGLDKGGSDMRLTGKQKLTRLVNFHVSAIVMIKVIIFMCTSMGLLNDAGIVVDPTQIAEFY